MAFSNIQQLIDRLKSVYDARGSLDCLLTVGTITYVTFFVGNAEPYNIDAPINLKWLRGTTIYVRTSRSASGPYKNTWVPVTTLEKALEAQQWDRIKPTSWETLQHVTNIDDPHFSALAFQDASNATTKFEYTSPSPSKTHTITHNKNTLTPLIAIYVDGDLVFTEIKIVNAYALTVTFPVAENCKVVVV